MQELEPFACAMFLIGAFSLAGVMHTLWLRWPGSAPLGIPLDGGRNFRGRRIFGDNKTLRGFVVMVPAAGIACWMLAAIVEERVGSPAEVGLWSLSSGQYLWLGLWLGFGFMAGELPNSFLKRQIGVEPGEAARHPVIRPVCHFIDRVDSILGLLVAAALVVPTPVGLWFYMLGVGAVIHGLFSVLLFQVGVKSTPA